MAIKYLTDKLVDNQVHQGDIFKSIHYYENYFEESGSFELHMLKFPYSIVLTQECDLSNNMRERNKDEKEGELKKQDKYLVSLLCAPLYNAEHLFTGNHLEHLKIQAERKNSDQRKYIKSNREPRYHYLEFDEKTQLVPMVVDFKHYFTVSVNTLENNIENRICSLKPIFRESITQRFSNFLARIGLPEPERIQ
ncbi:MAG: hypothetical protein JEY96_19225 [Bacteroidales bacterium]|nr:hypothetical protein [Bacteroidales bacterium]